MLHGLPIHPIYSSSQVGVQVVWGGRAAFSPPARLLFDRQPGGRRKNRPPGTYTVLGTALGYRKAIKSAYWVL